MDYKDRLPKDENVKKSFERYFGFMHAKINDLGDLDIGKMFRQKEDGWRIDYSQDIERIINDFINIYGYIYENGRTDGTSKLYRGTSTTEAKHLSTGREVGGALSTSLDEQIAKTFMQYGNSAILYVNPKKGLPFLYVEDLRENGRNESECLVLPFSRVKSAQFYSNWNGIKYYSIDLEKQDLPEIEDGKLEELKKECLSRFSKFEEDSKKYARLMDQGEALFEKARAGRGTPEDRAKSKEISDQILVFSKQIDEFKNKFSMMLKGLCRQREKDIDLKREDIAKVERAKKEEEAKKQIQAQRAKNARLTRSIDGCRTSIKDSISKSIEEFIKYNMLFKRIEGSLGIKAFNSSQNIAINLQTMRNQIINSMGQSLKKDLETALEKYDTSKETAEEILPHLVEEYKKQSEADVKAQLNKKVKGVIVASITDSFDSERKVVESQKLTLLQRVFNRNFKDAQLLNIDARQNFEKMLLQNSNPQNSVRAMLQQMYDYAYKFCGGKLTQGMENIERVIRQNYGNLPQAEDLRKNAMGKIQAGLPDIQRKKPSLFNVGRKETANLNENTNQLIEQTNASNHKGFITKVSQNGAANIYARIYETLQGIDNNIREASVEDRRTRIHFK